MFKIKKIVNGYLSENCYIIYNGSFALIIDPGSDKDLIIDFIKNNNLNVTHVLITHYHFDHTLCLEDIKNEYNCQVIDYKSKEKQNINGFKFDIIKTYGHTLDSVCFYFYEDKVMFTGDFLFKGTIGKYSSSNEDIMRKSIETVKDFNKDIIIYPGHGDESTIGDEIENNPFLNGEL